MYCGNFHQLEDLWTPRFDSGRSDESFCKSRELWSFCLGPIFATFSFELLALLPDWRGLQLLEMARSLSKDGRPFLLS